MAEAAVIVALGAQTAVGRSAWASAAAVRAGVAGFAEHPYLVDTAGEPMRGAIAPWLDIALTGNERLAALLGPTVTEALVPLDTLPPAARAEVARVALALALPEPRPGWPEDAERALLAHIAQQHPGRFASVATFAAGHAAGILALQAAAAKLARGELDACVLAGVDSYINPETMEWLEAQDQLHSAGPLNNAWGFIPGEAGATILLLRASLAQRLRLPVLARVLGSASAHEPKRIKTETICIGEGLSAALQGALAALPCGAQVSDIYCDLNGEPYRADEYGFSALRTKAALVSAGEFNAPADCWGDVGAAGALLHLQLACAAGAKGYARGPLALAWASAEGGSRAAALLATGGH